MHIAQNWRLNGQRYALKAVKCEQCEAILFPARAVCPHCEVKHVAYTPIQDRPLLIDLPQYEQRQAAR